MGWCLEDNPIHTYTLFLLLSSPNDVCSLTRRLMHQTASGTKDDRLLGAGYLEKTETVYSGNFVTSPSSHGLAGSNDSQ